MVPLKIIVLISWNWEIGGIIKNRKYGYQYGQFERELFLGFISEGLF